MVKEYPSLGRVQFGHRPLSLLTNPLLNRVPLVYPDSVEKETWLSLDLSSARGTIALHEKECSCDPRFISEAGISGDFKHSERLIITLDELLTRSNSRLHSVSRLITTSGPGSFTGLRIAFATLKAFAWACNIPIETISGSEARALAWVRLKNNIIPSNLVVLTRVAADRYLKVGFALERGKISPLSEKVVAGTEVFLPEDRQDIFLVDDANKAPRADAGFEIRAFPLSAKLLGDCLLSASSRMSHTNLEQWINLSPDYFGNDPTRHYRWIIRG